MKVGFIGLGRMGAGMAANLIKAGHELTLYNRTPGKADALLALGATRAGSIAAACRGEAIISMVANDEALHAIALGESGVVASGAAGLTHISMSTISIEMSERLRAAHAQAQQQFVAAPVIGRPEAAAAGKLFVLSAGERAAVHSCAPLFEAMGQKTYYLGTQPSAANLVKLSGNFLIATVAALIRKPILNC